jgi:membrane protease YdiL (CAAX protease family)
LNQDEAIALSAAPTSIRETLAMARGDGIGARITWSIRDIVGGLVLAVLAVIVLQVVLIGPALASGYDSEDSLVLGLAIVSTLIWNVFLVGLVLWLVRRKGGDWSSLGWSAPWPNQPWPPLKVVSIIASGLALMWFIQGFYVGVINAVGLDELLPDQQFPEGIFDEWWLVALLGLAVVLGAPIAEELFFRGFVYGGLRRRLSVLPPALMTGALFSVAHLQFGLLIPFSLIGMVLSIVYERAGSLRFNMALHMIFNTASFLALVLLPGARNG